MKHPITNLRLQLAVQPERRLEQHDRGQPRLHAPGQIEQPQMEDGLPHPLKCPERPLNGAGNDPQRPDDVFPFASQKCHKGIEIKRHKDAKEIMRHIRERNACLIWIFNNVHIEEDIRPLQDEADPDRMFGQARHLFEQQQQDRKQQIKLHVDEYKIKMRIHLALQQKRQERLHPVPVQIGQNALPIQLHPVIKHGKRRIGNQNEFDPFEIEAFERTQRKIPIPITVKQYESAQKYKGRRPDFQKRVEKVINRKQQRVRLQHDFHLRSGMDEDNGQDGQRPRDSQFVDECPSALIIFHSFNILI